MCCLKLHVVHGAENAGPAGPVARLGAPVQYSPDSIAGIVPSNVQSGEGTGFCANAAAAKQSMLTFSLWAFTTVLKLSRSVERHWEHRGTVLC
jgi:hypothetical protein